MDDEEGTMKRARKSGGPKYVPEYIKQQATLYRAVGRSPAENSLQIDLGYIYYVRYLNSQKKKKYVKIISIYYIDECHISHENS